MKFQVFLCCLNFHQDFLLQLLLSHLIKKMWIYKSNKKKTTYQEKFGEDMYQETNKKKVSYKSFMFWNKWMRAKSNQISIQIVNTDMTQDTHYLKICYISILNILKRRSLRKQQKKKDHSNLSTFFLWNRH